MAINIIGLGVVNYLLWMAVRLDNDYANGLVIYTVHSFVKGFMIDVPLVQ